MDEAQHDFLSEILNIGLGNAGAALSEMSGARVTMEVPKLTVCPAQQLPQYLKVFGDEEVLTVTQSFTGILSGSVVLILSTFSGGILTYRLFDGLIDKSRMEEQIEPAVTELGNIIINHFVGSWSKIFSDQFHFAVPEYEKERIQPILQSRLKDSGQEMHAIFAEAHMDIPDFFVVASLVTLFDKKSLEQLVGSVTAAARS